MTSIISQAAGMNPDNLAFRFPRPFPDCQCAICQRIGWSEERKLVLDHIPSVFIPHKIVAHVTVANQTPGGPIKRPIKVDADLNPEQHAAFVADFPALAYSAQPPNVITQPWVKAALKVTRTIRKLKPAAAFNAPVDPVALNIPDYPSIVVHPMDLSTVEAKLSPVGSTTCQYQSPEEWESDMRLIFCNAYLYNKAEHLVTFSAKECSIRFEQALLNLC